MILWIEAGGFAVEGGDGVVEEGGGVECEGVVCVLEGCCEEEGEDYGNGDVVEAASGGVGLGVEVAFLGLWKVLVAG